VIERSIHQFIEEEAHELDHDHEQAGSRKLMKRRAADCDMQVGVQPGRQNHCLAYGSKSGCLCLVYPNEMTCTAANHLPVGVVITHRVLCHTAGCTASGWLVDHTLRQACLGGRSQPGEQGLSRDICGVEKHRFGFCVFEQRRQAAAFFLEALGPWGGLVCCLVIDS